MTHELLNVDWAHLFEGQDMNSMWLCFHTTILKLIDKYIPIKTFNSKHKPKWLDCSTLKKIKIKYKAWNIYKATRRYKDFISYTRCRNIATTVVKYAKSSFETKLAKNIQQNLTYFGNMLEITQRYDTMLTNW